MQIFNELTEIADLSIALGYFDGVHLGHQAVIKSAVEFAENSPYPDPSILTDDVYA